jgi:ABC-type cobalamin/Fe3+-siderophores transport system ATPase subunit
MAVRRAPSTRNLFAGGGVASVGVDFTDRAPERRAIAEALRTPGGHLLLVGPRRIGKTSLLRAVQHDIRKKKGPPVLYLDLWSVSTIEDMTTRLAVEAAVVLGQKWTDLVRTLAQRLQFKLEVSTLPDGRLVPIPTVSFRDAPRSEQRARLVAALDTLDAQAKAHKVHLGVILDEFQEIERLGRAESEDDAVSAMRQLRAAIQHHRHVSYVFAGSDRALIARLSEPKHGPMHNLARRYEIGPLPEAHFAAWIEDRFAAMGINASGCGAAIIALAGPRTRDVRTLAESAVSEARVSGRLAAEALDAPLRGVVNQRRPQYEAAWKGLTMLQQNCLRAVAAGERRLTSAVVLERYSLGDTSRTAKALAALVEASVLVRDGKIHTFDDPFFRAWAIEAVLPDVGLTLPITHLPVRGAVTG